MGGCHLRQSNEFLRFGKGTRDVDQPRAQAYRAVLHRLIYETLHRSELLRIRRPDEAAAHGQLAHRAMADQCGNVEGDL